MWFYFLKDAFPIAKLYWQHTGEGISSRCIEYCLHLMQAKRDEQYYITENSNEKSTSAPRKSSFHKRYSSFSQLSMIGTNFNKDSFISNVAGQTSPTDLTFTESSATDVEENFYVEERYGRNLPITFIDKAKIALRRRIAGVLGVEEQINDNKIDDIN